MKYHHVHSPRDAHTLKSQTQVKGPKKTKTLVITDRKIKTNPLIQFTLQIQHDITICWVRAWLNHSSNHKKESKTANAATNYITKSAISSQPTKQQSRAANELKLPLQLHYKPISSLITSKQRLLASKKQKQKQKKTYSAFCFLLFFLSTTSISHNDIIPNRLQYINLIMTPCFPNPSVNNGQW